MYFKIFSLISFAFCASNSSFSQQLSLEEVLAQERALVAGQGVRAQLIAVKNTVLSAGIAGKIRAVPYSIGDFIEENDILVDFDCDSLLARQKIVAAEKRVSEINLSVKQRLFELNNVGAQEIDLSEAEAAAAAAQLEVIQLQVDDCVIRAPFSGRVVGRNADPFETVNAGTELIEILAQDDLEVLLVAPSNWLSWLEVGAQFELSIEEVNAQHRGEIIRLGGRVDSVSQTVLVWGKISDASDKLLPGMSGNITFKEPF